MTGSAWMEHFGKSFYYGRVNELTKPRETLCYNEFDSVMEVPAVITPSLHGSNDSMEVLNTMATGKRYFLFALPLLLAGLFALWLLPGATPAAAADAQWRARYYNNRNLSGNPVWERNEDKIDNDWGGGSPNPNVVSDDNFSVKWTRNVELPAGNYRFFATMDDGMRVWIDEQLVIDNWTDSQQHTVTADRYLGAGNHFFRVEYYEAGGVAVAKFNWQQIGGGTPGTFSGWRGEYFNNMTLSGAPLVTRDDAAVNFDWGTGSPAPGIAADRFSVRWTRTLNFNPGTYRFDVFSDDGVRLWVNNVLVIDQWRDQSDGRFSANVNLSGATTIRLEYYENVGRAAVNLSWNPPGGNPIGGGTGGPTTGAFFGEYYNNQNLSGSPTATRNDPVINFNWGNGSPIAGVAADHFSVRWTQIVNFPAGTYRFDVFSDDGVRLWANNQILVDQWRDQTDGRFTATVALSGPVEIEMEYYENTGRAAVSLSWTAVSGGSPAPAPGGATATVTGTGGSRLNVRATPGGTIIGQLAPNQTVGLTGYQSADKAWLEIIRPGGGTGWVSARYVTTSVPTTNFPVR